MTSRSSNTGSELITVSRLMMGALDEELAWRSSVWAS